MLEKIKDEPVLVTSAVSALVGLGVAFGLHLSPVQVGAINAVVVAGLAFVARSQVTPSNKILGKA